MKLMIEQIMHDP